VIQEIVRMYQEDGQAPPEPLQRVSVYYNRGVFNAALMVEAVRLALEKFGTPITGEKVKQGFESIKDFSLGGFVPPHGRQRGRPRRGRLGTHLPGQGQELGASDRLVHRLPRGGMGVGQRGGGERRVTHALRTPAQC
jgi:hypothetical protein